MTNGIKAVLAALLILSAMCATAAADAPATWDWRDVNGTNYMTPVKDQDTCGSCWAFSTISVIEAAYKIYADPTTDLDLSEQYFVSDCFLAGDCGGGRADDVLTRAEDVGVPTEECFPYISENGPCTPCSNWEEDAYLIEGYTRIDHNTAAYKQAIMEYGPITSEKVSVNHAICVVGWNDSTETWIYKNSFGSSPLWDGYSEVGFGELETTCTSYAITGMVRKWQSPVSVFASSNQTSYPASNAIDGNYRLHANSWMSEPGVPCWIQFDLGAQADVESAYMALGDWGGVTRFDIDVSSDNNTWYSAVEGGEVPEMGKMFEVPINEEFRYLRLEITAANNNVGVCYEFGVILSPPLCPCDLNGDGFVNNDDVLNIVLNWGPCTGCPEDLNGDGFVNNDDITCIVLNWGPCP